MENINYTLIGDGSSDKALLKIIKWLLDDLYPTIPNSGHFADFSFLSEPPKKGDIKGQIACAKKYFPFDILFYHRDAESTNKDIIAQRKLEIFDKLDADERRNVICVVPIRMMEAWLLIDPNAIKKAAGNRNSKEPINLPPIKKIEAERDPKQTIQNILRTASGRKGRNLNGFNVQEAIHLVADNITDYGLLRGLTAFQEFENDLSTVVNTLLTK